MDASCAASKDVRLTFAEFGHPRTCLPRMTKRLSTSPLRYKVARPSQIKSVTKSRLCLHSDRRTSVAEVGLTSLSARSGEARLPARSLPRDLVAQGHLADHPGAHYKDKAAGGLHAMSAKGQPHPPMRGRRLGMQQPPSTMCPKHCEKNTQMSR